MSENVNIPDLERITFFPGQLLAAADLAALQRANREMRWLHNRSLHAWGIGIGFAVTGERGNTAVTIGPGYGVDCLGREIILTGSKTKTVPAVAGALGGGEAVYYLVAAYQADADQKVAERRPGVCLPEGTVCLSEEPLIDWRRPDQPREGLELVLAQAWIQNCQLSRPLSLAARRYARPSQQPYIAAGQTEMGKTAWEAWQIDNNPQIGVLTRVDTSAARFRATPHYVAHIVGGRFLKTNPPGPLVLVGLTGIAAATPKQFTVEVLLPAFGQSDPPVNPQLPGIVDVVNNLQWHVVWMGIEG
jgi:hypothetical protein